MYFSYSTALYKNKSSQKEANFQDTFAEKMFELEAKLQYEGSIEIIRELNDHYRAGIDYYIEKDSRRATHLQKKMTSLLANPDNIRILERETKKNNQAQSISQPKAISSPQAQIQSPSLTTRKLKQQVSKFHTVADSCIQNMVQNSNKRIDTMQRLKRKDLNKQQQQLNDRIMLKRVRSQQKLNRIKSQTNLPGIILTASVSQQKTENIEPGALKELIQ